MLQVTDLDVRYGGIRALKKLSMHIPEGQIITLIGANGAGKSSLLRTIAGLVRCSEGSILYQNEEITTLSPWEIVDKGITLVPEGRRIFPDMTVLENLKIGAFLRNDPSGIKRDIDYMYSLFPRLRERQKQMGGTLSGGEQQMLAVARALMAKPKLLMMDEPSLGLAPLIVKDIFEIIQRINDEEGVTILLVEQNAHLALNASNYGYVLEIGEIGLEGPCKDLIHEERVKDLYLGE